MDPVVRWALASATKTKDPSLTAFVLPHRDKDAYRQYMNHPLVHCLLRVPKKQFKFKKPDFWRADGGNYASHPEWDVDIFIFSNEVGLQFVKPNLLGSKATGSFTSYRRPCIDSPKNPAVHRISLSSGPSRNWRYMPKRSDHGHLLQGRHLLTSFDTNESLKWQNASNHLVHDWQC